MTDHKRQAEGHQLVVGVGLDDLAIADHQDRVGHAHRREAVGDQDGDGPGDLRDAASPERVLLEQVLFGLGVKGRRRFVEEEQEGALAHHGPAEGELLPLAAAQVGAGVEAAIIFGVAANLLGAILAQLLVPSGEEMAAVAEAAPSPAGHPGA
jgi:hypothetical protein